MNTYKQLWAIHAPGHESGETVTVTLKSGKIKRVQLGLEIRPGSCVFMPFEIDKAIEDDQERQQDRQRTPPPSADQASLAAAFASSKARKESRENHPVTGCIINSGQFGDMGQ